MRNFTIGLLGAAVLTTTILLVRQQKDEDGKPTRIVPAGETQPAYVSLDRIRELGL